MSLQSSLSILLPTAALVALTACGGPTDEASAGASSAAGSQPGSVEPSVAVDLDAGRALYLGKGNCATCHGKQGQGNSMLGPSLAGMAEHWDRAGLSAFFANPSEALAADARLAELVSRYASPMPPATALDADECDAVADWVLSL